MGKLLLVSGPNDSGKSRFAEALLSGFSGEKFYIATMVPQTAENRVRIEKHRAQRAGLGFQTLELPGPVAAAPVTPASAVLLEDVSNLLANCLFDRNGSREEVLSDLLALKDRCALLCAVTISGLSPEGYAGETAAYIRALDWLNERIFALSDAAAAMERGRPRWDRGDSHALF